MQLPRLPQVSEGEASARGHLWGTTLCPHHPGLGVEWGAETQPLVKGPQPGLAPGERRRKPWVEHPAETCSQCTPQGISGTLPGPTPNKTALPSQGAALPRGGLRWPPAPWGAQQGLQTHSAVASPGHCRQSRWRPVARPPPPDRGHMPGPVREGGQMPVGPAAHTWNPLHPVAWM